MSVWHHISIAVTFLLKLRVANTLVLVSTPSHYFLHYVKDTDYSHLPFGMSLSRLYGMEYFFPSLHIQAPAKSGEHWF